MRFSSKLIVSDVADCSEACAGEQSSTCADPHRQALTRRSDSASSHPDSEAVQFYTLCNVLLYTVSWLHPQF